MKFIKVHSKDTEKQPHPHTNLQHRVGQQNPPAISLYETGGKHIEFTNDTILAVEDALITGSDSHKYWKLVSTVSIVKKEYKADPRPAGWPDPAYVKDEDVKPF